MDTALLINSSLRRLLFKVGREEEFQLPERMVQALLQELEGKTLEQVRCGMTVVCWQLDG